MNIGLSIGYLRTYFVTEVSQVSIPIILCNTNWNRLFCGYTVYPTDSNANGLNDLMFDSAVFMIIVSWTSGAHNCMISCDPSATRKAKSVLLQINQF